MKKDIMIKKLEQTILAIESSEEDSIAFLNNIDIGLSIDLLNERVFRGTGRSTYTLEKVLKCITDNMFDKDILILYYCKNYREAKYHMDKMIEYVSPLLKIIISRSGMSIGIGGVRIDFLEKGKHHVRRYKGLRYDKVIIFEDHNVYDCNYDWYESDFHPRKEKEHDPNFDHTLWAKFMKEHYRDSNYMFKHQWDGEFYKGE